MLTPLSIAILFGAGIVSGIVGAVAGGAGLFSFPALLAAGIDPVTATASNFIALFPLGVAAAIPARKMLAGTGRRMLALTPAVLGGTVIGGALLLWTPVPVFAKFFPLLLLFATTLFALSPYVSTTGARDARDPASAHAALFLASIYGGYFGAGVGIIMIAALSRMRWESLGQANAVKNILLSAASVAIVFVFVAGDVIAWPETLVLMVGATLGGYVGALIALRLPANRLRFLILAIGYSVSCYYAWGAWFAS